MSAAEDASLNTHLANLVVALLTPMFLWATAGDIHLAQVAAAQTLNEFRIANRLSLFSVGKIIAFDIATLSSLGQSMYEDVSVLLALRLRGNATSLDRSSERNKRLYEQEGRRAAAGQTEDSVEAVIAEAQRMVQQAKARVQAATAPAAEPLPDPIVPAAAPQPDAAPLTSPAKEAAPAPVPPAAKPAPAPAAGTPAQQRQSAWAQAMTMVAEEFKDGLKDLPPEERWKEMARIEALTIAAADLASGTAKPVFPGMAAGIDRG